METIPTAKELDWKATGQRLLGYRLMKGKTREEIANECGLKAIVIKKLEKATRQYSNLNNLWTFVRLQGVSANWLFNGIGEYHDQDHAELLPKTIVYESGIGIRRTPEQIGTDEGTYQSDPLEFAMAVDAFKRLNNKPFPKLTEIFEVIKALGYRKVAIPTVFPKGRKHDGPTSFQDCPCPTLQAN